eukprot:GFUD01006035.1.p1 GENE.GFUD01006035.1~~GFUD01006035.1.p1  ORF type:complete len:489 (-),score=162.34 GFUD01006035.1:66-1532(-)
MDGLNQVQFRIVENEQDGRHLVAIRDLSPGDLIFNESPTAFSPGVAEGVCIVCLRRIEAGVCSKCWWPVCGERCKESTVHQEECRYLASCLASGEDSSLPTRHLLVLRCLLLKNNPRVWDRVLRLRGHHGMQSLIQKDEDFIMDPYYRDLAMFIRNDCGLTNVASDELAMVYTLVTSSSLNMAVEGREFPGLYLTGALLTQSCIQNTRCVFKGRDNKLFLYAATDIKKGEKITHSRLKNLVHTGTIERRRVLKEMFVDCYCPRCSGQSEMGTHVSAVLCQRCEGMCLPQNPTDQDSPWQCAGCGAGVSADFVNTLLLSIQEEELQAEEGMSKLEAFTEKNKRILPANHYLITSEKAKFFLQFNATDSATTVTKIQAGKEILQLADSLEPGLSLHRESILIHLGTCLQILVGNEMMRIYSGADDDETLSDQEIFAAFRDANICFKQALASAVLEEALDGSKKTATGKIRESLSMLEDMKRDFDNMDANA